MSIEVLTVHVQASLQALFSLNKEVQPSDEALPHFLLLRIVYKAPNSIYRGYENDFDKAVLCCRNSRWSCRVLMGLVIPVRAIFDAAEPLKALTQILRP